MAITLKGITTLARIGLPIMLIADFAVASPYLEGPWPASVHFGLAYMTSLAMLLAFHRRPAIELAVGAAIILILAWALNTIGNDTRPLLAALAGGLCGLIPAYVRDFQTFARTEEYMDLDQLRHLRRRRTDLRDEEKRPHPLAPIRIRERVTVLSDRRAEAE